MTDVLTAPAPAHEVTLPFTPKWTPLSHQAEFLEANARRANFGLFWEQGTGKSYALILNVALLAVEDGLEGALVLAPNGVHRNWALGEVPEHWPPDAPAFVAFAWDTDKANTKAFKAEFERFLAHPAPVKWLCMSYDAMMTDAGRQASWRFIKTRRVMMIADESQRIGEPGAARTKRVIAASPYPAYRRLASGTPCDTPFNMYSQIRFLDAMFWQRSLGIAIFSAFKSWFGEIETVKAERAGRVVTYEKVKAYKRLDEMNGAIAPISSRVLKEDVLDLPPKNYKKVFHELTNSQRVAYEELRKEALTILEGGELVTAELALVLDLRLAQIGCGFIKPAPGEPEVPFVPNPRARMLVELLTDLTRPSIIWGRFVHDTRIAAAASRKAGRRPAIFDGSRPDDSLEAFHRGEVDDLIANLGSNMREGYTLNEADTTIYYSNTPALRPRLQSEDRNHRIGQSSPVTYIDLLAEGTTDAKRLTALTLKRQSVGTVLGDDPLVTKQWLMEALS